MYSKVKVGRGSKLVIVTAHGDILNTYTTGPTPGVQDAYIVASKRKLAAGAMYGIVHAPDVFVGSVRIDGCLRSGKRKPISWEEAYVNFLSIFPQVSMGTYKTWARVNQKRLAHVLDIWEDADKLMNQVSDNEIRTIMLRARDRAAALTSALRAGGVEAVCSVLEQEALATAFTSPVKARLMDRRARIKAAAPLRPVDESESLTLQRCVDEGCWPASDPEDESMDEGYYVAHPSDAASVAAKLARHADYAESGTGSIAAKVRAALMPESAVTESLLINQPKFPILSAKAVRQDAMRVVCVADEVEMAAAKATDGSVYKGSGLYHGPVTIGSTTVNI